MGLLGRNPKVIIIFDSHGNAQGVVLAPFSCARSDGQSSSEEAVVGFRQKGLHITDPEVSGLEEEVS